MTIKLFGYEFTAQKVVADPAKVSQFLSGGQGAVFAPAHRPQFGLRTWTFLTPLWERRYIFVNRRRARQARLDAQAAWMGPKGEGFDSPSRSCGGSGRLPAWKR